MPILTTKVKKVIGVVLTVWGAIRYIPDLLESGQATAKYGKWLYAHLSFPRGGYLTVALFVMGIGIIFSSVIEKWIQELRRKKEKTSGSASPINLSKLKITSMEMYEAAELKPTTEGPNIGVVYSYSEQVDGVGEDGTGKPITLTNISLNDSAHNVRVLPFTVGDLTATFEPDLIPFIEARGKATVKPCIPTVFPTLRDKLPILFKRSYRDKSMEELMGTHSYPMHIEYEDGANRKVYGTSAVFRYRPWKTVITVGETKRRLKRLI
jgi:hypothetical protein